MEGWLYTRKFNFEIKWRVKMLKKKACVILFYMSDFFQDAPKLRNSYISDRVLRSYLRRVLPTKMLSEIEPDLKRFGERAVTELVELAQEAEKYPPRHIP